MSPSGAPLTSSTSADGGPDLELSPENAAQVLQSGNPFLLLVGELDKQVTKKVAGLRKAAQGRLPLVRLNCSALPQVCEALQIVSSPTLLLMAKGQVVAALEQMSPQTATAFVENVAQMLGLKVDLAEAVTEQLQDAELQEWKDLPSAEQSFGSVLSRSDLPNDARVRALAGRARCLLRRREPTAAQQSKVMLEELQAAGHGGVPEVKQAVAMLWIDQKQQELGETNLQTLKAAWEANPTDFAAVQAYAVSIFWAHGEAEAFEAGLQLLRRKRSDEARQLVLSLVEALGPSHPRSAPARRSFSNALFI